MKRDCDRCRQGYVVLPADPPDGLCPTCRAGMAPLLTLVSGKPRKDLTPKLE